MKYVGSMSYCACDGVGFLVTCSSLLWLLVSQVQYDILPTYFKNNYRLKATLLGTNLLPDDGFI